MAAKDDSSSELRKCRQLGHIPFLALHDLARSHKSPGRNRVSEYLCDPSTSFADECWVCIFSVVRQGDQCLQMCPAPTSHPSGLIHGQLGSKDAAGSQREGLQCCHSHGGHPRSLTRPEAQPISVLNGYAKTRRSGRRSVTVRSC